MCDMMLRDNAKYLLPALCLAIAVPAAFGGSAQVDLAASHLSSTYTGGSWSVPDDADIDDGFCPCLTVSDVAVTQDLNDMTTNAVAVSVLSELPAGEKTVDESGDM